MARPPEKRQWRAQVIFVGSESQKYTSLSYTFSKNNQRWTWTWICNLILWWIWILSFLLNQIWIGFDCFDLLRNFQLSVGNSDYCIEEFNSVEFLKYVGIVLCVCFMFNLDYDQWNKSAVLCVISSKLQNWSDFRWSNPFSWLIIVTQTVILIYHNSWHNSLLFMCLAQL